MSEFNIEDLDAVIASAESSLVQMLALQLRGQIRKSDQMAADNEKAMDSLRQADAAVKLAHEKYSAIAAENVAIREQSEEVYAAGYNHGHLNTVDGIAYAGCVKDDFYSLALQVMAEIESPATDAYLAGIKSHDLDAFISHYSAELDTHIANGGDQFDATSIRLRGFIVGGRMFREKLRDEEKTLALREGADK